MGNRGEKNTEITGVKRWSRKKKEDWFGILYSSLYYSNERKAVIEGEGKHRGDSRKTDIRRRP